jgi:hypothetical protein
MSNEQENPTAEEQSNTVNAEEQSNTITQEQFNAYIQSNDLKVFNNDQFETLQSNLLKEGTQKSFQSTFGKALDKAKNALVKKFNLELDEGAQFEDALNAINLKSGKDDSKDLEILRNKLLETESNYQNQIAEMQNKYQAKEIESVYNSVWSELQGQIEGTKENIEKYKKTYFLDVQQSLDFTGDVVKRGEYEYKDELRNALSKTEAIKNYLLDSLPLKPTKPVNGGNGLSQDNIKTSNSQFANFNSLGELANELQRLGIDPNSEQGVKIATDWSLSKK